jgi:mannose-6-phosphate isomerase
MESCKGFRDVFMRMQNLQSMGPLELRGKAQSYSWGKVGASSRISGFLGRFEATATLAEYWLGTHPKGPSDVLLPSGEIVPLGTLVGGSAELSFMLKVLSINPDFGLSIQSHPDSSWAKILHERDPSNYPDASHKPEIGVALTPVTLLFGFRTISAIAEIVHAFPAFERLWGADLTGRLRKAAHTEHQPEVLKDLFSGLLNASQECVASVSREVCESGARVKDFTEEISIVNRLCRCYGEADPGLLAVFMMNIVHVGPGEAVFIGPNCPHAYLDGDLVECMASSDNVIRAGLTPKFKDTATLLETVSYAEVGPPSLATTREMIGDLAVFDLPSKDFVLATAPHGSEKVSLGAMSRDAILLCAGNGAKVAGPTRLIELRDGGAVFLPALSGPYTITCHEAAIFLATQG